MAGCEHVANLGDGDHWAWLFNRKLVRKDLHICPVGVSYDDATRLPANWELILI